MEKIAPVLAEAEFTFEFKEPANLPNPMLAISDALSFGYRPEDAARTRPPSCAASAAPCWPASASASWAPTARASPRWSRPSPARWRRWRHDDRGQGPGIGYFRPAGAGRAAPRTTPAGAHDPPGRETGRANSAEAAASRTCAASWAASTSAATWSSRPWAA
jgi:hypothetical protein